MESFIKKGKFQSAEFLLMSTFSISDEIIFAVNLVNSTIQTIKSLLQSKLLIPEKLEPPSFRWAQSMKYIFIEIKTSATFNSPGFADILSFEYHSGKELFNITIDAYQDEKLIRYNLKLEFYKRIVPEWIIVSNSSAGKIFVNITKSYPSNWKRLLKSEDKPNNMVIWWELKAKYEEEIRMAAIHKKRQKETENYVPKSRRNKTEEEEEKREKIEGIFQ